MACINKRSHCFTCHPHVYPLVEWTIPAFTPQPQSITTLSLVLISRPTEGRRLSWPTDVRHLICSTREGRLKTSPIPCNQLTNRRNTRPAQSLDSAHWISLLYCSARWPAKPSGITDEDLSGQCVTTSTTTTITTTTTTNTLPRPLSGHIAALARCGLFSQTN